MKSLLKLFLLLIVLILIAGGIFLWTFDINKYRESITTELSQALNRPVTIEKIAMKISLIPTISLSNVTVGNPAGFKSAEPLANAGTVELTIALPPLMHKEVQIRDIQIKNATINFIQLKDGNNITFSDSKSTTKPTVSKPSTSMNTANPYLAQLKVDTIGIDKVLINYQNGEQKEQILLNDITIQQLKALSAKILYHDIPMNLTANMSLMNLVQMNNNFIFNAQLTALGSTTKVSGSIGDMKNFQNILLNLDMVVDNLSNMATKLGTNLPLQITDASFSSIIKGSLDKMDIQTFKLSLGEGIVMDLKGTLRQVKTNPLTQLAGTIIVKNTPVISQTGVQPMTITLSTNAQNGSANISKLSLNANRSDIDSAFKINWNKDKIDITGTVDSNFLNPYDFYKKPYQETTQQPKAADKQPAQITQSKKDTANNNILNKLNAQIDWKLQNVELTENSGDYYGIFGRTVLKNGVFTAKPVQVKTIAGIINGILRVQNITGIPQTQLTFSGENISLDKIKKLHKYVSGSTANLSGNISTVGLDQTAILSHLSGNVEVEVTQGKVVNKEFNDLPQEIGLLTKNKSFSYSKTDTESILNCAVMNLKMNNGIVKMDKSVAIETSVLDVMLSGQVNLANQTLSVTLNPSLPSGTQNRLLNAAQLIKIEGPITKPKMSLDTNKIVSKGIEKGIEKGVNKLMKKAGLNTNEKENTATESVSSARPPLSLCESALGHKLKGKKNANMPIVQPTPATKPTTTVPTQQKEEQLTPQEVLKKQLIKSLSSAIQ